MSRTHYLSIAFLVVTSGILGCSGGNPVPAKVSGSVTYKGQPVKGGTMNFYGPDGVPYPAQIQPDGTYSATDIPAGELVVTIETESFKSKGTPKGGDAEKRMKIPQQKPPAGATVTAREDLYVKIPEKYAKQATSPLTVKLSSGRNVENFELTD